MGFKENFRAELTYSGILIKEIAATTGISYRTLNNYLSKKGQLPSIETGVKIARALGVSVEYLVSGEHPDENRRDKAELRAIGRLAKTLTFGKRKFLLDMLRLLANNTYIE